MSVLKFIGLLCFLIMMFVRGLGNHLPLRILGPVVIIQDSIKVKLDTSVFMIVEIPAEFPGGNAGLFNYIKTVSKYPVTYFKSKASETVYLKLLIEKDGSVSHAAIAFPDVKKKREEEAKRIASQMPKWRPGYQSGRRLRTYAMVPIHFK